MPIVTSQLLSGFCRVFFTVQRPHSVLTVSSQCPPVFMLTRVYSVGYFIWPWSRGVSRTPVVMATVWCGSPSDGNCAGWWSVAPATGLRAERLSFPRGGPAHNQVTCSLPHDPSARLHCLCSSVVFIGVVCVVVFPPELIRGQREIYRLHCFCSSAWSQEHEDLKRVQMNTKCNVFFWSYIWQEHLTQALEASKVTRSRGEKPRGVIDT